MANEAVFTLEPGALSSLAPMSIVLATAFLVLLWDVIAKPRDRGILLGFSIAGLALAAIVSLILWSHADPVSHTIFSGRLAIDRFSLFFNLVFSVVATLVLMISRDYLIREQIDVGEYYALIMFSVFGMMLLAAAADLLMLFIGVEAMSIPVYVLVAFNRSRIRCIEGALKYFILGAFATAFLLYGIALLYGQTGTTSLADIHTFLEGSSGSHVLVPVGIALMIVGFGFKIGSVPFHMWTPDAYEGAATPVTAIMATGVKAAAFAAIIRAFLAFSPSLVMFRVVLWVIVALTVVVGNIAAIRQLNLKRMLAYSSIAHSGYMLAALLAIEPIWGPQTSNAMSSLLYYLLAYLFMNIGAFGVIVVVGSRENEAVDVRDWAGLGFKYPWLGAAMALFMLSLGGLPPTAGFFAKFYLFSAVVHAGYTPLIILAVLMSAASFFYYLRVVVYMYMQPSEGACTPTVSPLAAVAIGVSALATLWLGIAPSALFPFLEWAQRSVAVLL